jgi:hypothetical protein
VDPGVRSGVSVAGAVLPTRTRHRRYDAFELRGEDEYGNELRSFAAAEDAVQDALVEAVRLVGLGRQLASEPDRFGGVWSARPCWTPRGCVGRCTAARTPCRIAGPSTRLLITRLLVDRG